MPEPSAPPPGPRVRLPPALPADGLPGYAELHGLSNFSFLRGASHPEELVERAYQLGYAALAMGSIAAGGGAGDARLVACTCMCARASRCRT
jgi:hypothetical protein